MKQSEDVGIPAPVPRKPGAFAPGHARLGGRKKGTKSWSARAIAEETGVHPIRVLLDMMKTGYFPLAKGEQAKDKRRIPPELYVKVVFEATAYCTPKLSAVQLTGANNGPLAVAALDVTELMKDPALVAAAQTLALGLSGYSEGQEQWDERGNHVRPALPPVSG